MSRRCRSSKPTPTPLNGYSTRQNLRNSCLGSVSRHLFSPISAEMLNSNFLLGEEVQNVRFLKFRLLFCKGVQYDLFFLSGCQECFISTWHPPLIIHKIFIRNHALQDCTHQKSSWTPPTTLLWHYSYLGVKATQSTWSTLPTLGVNVLPLLLVADFSPPASESPS